MRAFFFSAIEVTKQVFYRSSLSCAIVNLKPIVPGHVLVIPTRVVPRLSDLNDSELACLMRSVQHVGRVVEHVYGGDGLTIACQDGKAAGQSIPHVHFHLMPRKLKGDRFEESNDEIYPELERTEKHLAEDLHQIREDLVEPLHVDADDARPARSVEEMMKEAEWLSTFFSQEGK